MSLVQANGRGRGRLLSKKSLLRRGERQGRARLALSRGVRGCLRGLLIRTFPLYHWVRGEKEGAQTGVDAGAGAGGWRREL
jgi:hypothetical protein